MKNVSLFSACFLFVISCTNLSTQDTVKNFMPGTYVHPFKDSLFEHTNVIGTDTLRIKKQTESGSETYQIDRALRYQRTLDGKTQPEEYKKETWTASYQETDKTLYIKNTGATLVFDPQKNLLKMDAKEFNKIE